MTTSGTYVLSYTVNEIIEEAFDLLQIAQDGETLSGDMVSRGKKALNMLIKTWQAQGAHLWTYTEGTLFLGVGTEKYDFRLAATKAANEWFETTTTADTTAGANTFSVTSAANIQENDIIGIIQSDNNLFWTTVDTVSGLSIKVDDDITLATTSGAFVRNYRPSSSTNVPLKPIARMIDVRRKEADDYEIPIILGSRQDYFDLPNKEQSGTPIQSYYDRQDIAGEDSGVLYLWSSPNSAKPVINFTYERKIQIMDNSTDTLDMPEWMQEAVIYNLATKLIPRYGCTAERAAWIKAEAMNLEDLVLTFDQELKPIRVEMVQHG